jgi:tryptophan synthase alpha chain
MSTSPGAAIARSIREQRESTRAPAIVPYVTAGFPSKQAFRCIIESIAPEAAAIEIGVPFSDPMADGVTIQRSSRIALEQGVDLDWILSEASELRARISVPLILMGYLNPFLRFGFAALARGCEAAGVHALIIPDLPLEESEGIRELLTERGVGLVQLVSPVTPPARAQRLAAASHGFVYAVTTTGVTGGGIRSAADAHAYLRQIRERCPIPVCAGFGVRTATDVASFGQACDGVIVGSALAEAIDRGHDPGQWLRQLRQPPGSA